MSKKLSSQLTKLKKEQLKQKENALKKNTTITKGTSKNQEVIKEGLPLNHQIKHDPRLFARTVGASIGTTLNMGDYESLRIDAWLTDELQEDETQEEALDRVTSILEKHIEEVADSYKG